MNKIRKVYLSALEKLVTMTSSTTHRVMDAINSLFGVPSDLDHTHEDLLDSGNKPTSPRLGNTTVSGFSTVEHSHPELLVKDAIAQNTDSLGGVTSGYFSGSEHTHSDLKTYLQTTPFTLVDAVDRMWVATGVYMTPGVEKARKEHTHPELVARGVPVLSARHILKTTVTGNYVRLSPEAFSPADHNHTQYIEGETALATYVTVTHTVDAASGLEINGAAQKLLIMEITPDTSYDQTLSLNIDYKPVRDMTSLDIAVTVGAYDTTGDFISTDSFFNVRRDIFGSVTNLKNYLYEASLNERVLSDRHLPVVVEGDTIKGSAVYTNGLTYIYCWEDSSLTAPELIDLLGESGFRDNVVAADDAFTLRSNIVGKALAGTGDDRELFDGIDYHNVLVIGANTAVESDTPIIRLPEDETNIYSYIGVSENATEPVGSDVLTAISEDRIKAGPSRYIEVRTSRKIAAAMDVFFKDSVLLAPAPVTVPVSLLFNLWAADTIDGEAMPDSLDLVEDPVTGKLQIDDPDETYAGKLKCVSLQDALQGMDDYDFLYIYLGRGEDSGSIASNLAWLGLQAGSAADRTITRMLNSMTRTVNNILGAGYPLLMKLPSTWTLGGVDYDAIAVWMTDGQQLSYKPPLMDSVMLGANPEETVLFKRVLVKDLKEAYASETYKQLRVLGISPLLADASSEIPLVSRLALGMREPGPMIVSANSYAVFGTHTIQLPEAYSVNAVQVVPGGKIGAGDTFPDDEKAPPQTVTQYYPLAGVDSKAVKVNLPPAYGKTSPRLVGYGGNLVTVRSGGQPYTLYMWATKAEEET